MFTTGRPLRTLIDVHSQLRLLFESRWPSISSRSRSAVECHCTEGTAGAWNCPWPLSALGASCGPRSRRMPVVVLRPRAGGRGPGLLPSGPGDRVAGDSRGATRGRAGGPMPLDEPAARKEKEEEEDASMARPGQVPGHARAFGGRGRRRGRRPAPAGRRGSAIAGRSQEGHWRCEGPSGL